MNIFAELHGKLTQVAVVAAMVVLASCTATIESGGGTVQEELSLLDRLPAGAEAVAYVDLAAIAASMTPEQWAEYEEMFRDEENLRNLERFTEATGIDPREDLRQLAFASMPGGEADEFLMLMSADFDDAKLRDLAAGAETVTYEGIDLYRAADVFERLEEVVGPAGEADAADDPGVETATEEAAYLSILDSETLAMGSETGLRQTIDVVDGRREAVMTDPRIAERIAEVRDEGQVWMVAGRESWQQRVDDLDAGAGGMVPTDAIGSIEMVTFSMRMGDGMALALSGIAADADAAMELSNSMNGLLAIGRMMLAEGEPELLAILDRGIEVSQQERQVRLEANLTAADIAVLQRLAEEQAAQR